MQMKEESRSKLMLISAMVIFGTIGIFRRYIPLPSGTIAFARGVIGVIFLLAVVGLGGKKISKEAVKNNLAILCISGALIGFNWILLFESYQYTSVATATLCYYMEPVFVILASSVLFREKLTGKKILCTIVAFIGMILVSGVLQVGISGLSEMKGILFGLGAAALYSSVVLMNKKLKEISAYDKTIVQLASASIVILPYILAAEDISGVEFTPLMIIMLLVVGVIHTGMAYAMYFGSMGNLKAQTIAIFSYIDPIIAVILSAVILHENMDIMGWTGAVLVLGAAMWMETGE